jgi:large repetitive protein
MTNRVSVATPATVTDPNTANNTAVDTTAIAKPAVTSVTPSSGARGTTSLPITITGTGLTGSTGVTVSGAGVTCTGVSAPSDTTVTATCSITSAAGLTARSVTVTGGSYGNTPAFASAFTVTGATPTISAPSPALNTGGTGTKTGTITVSNAAAATAPLTLTAAPSVVQTVPAPPAASKFSITGGTCANGTVINPGGSCTIVVQYLPGGVTTTATAHVSLANSGAATNPLNGGNFNGN